MRIFGAGKSHTAKRMKDEANEDLKYLTLTLPSPAPGLLWNSHRIWNFTIQKAIENFFLKGQCPLLHIYFFLMSVSRIPILTSTLH